MLRASSAKSLAFSGEDLSGDEVLDILGLLTVRASTGPYPRCLMATSGPALRWSPTSTGGVLTAAASASNYATLLEIYWSWRPAGTASKP